MTPQAALMPGTKVPVCNRLRAEPHHNLLLDNFFHLAANESYFN